MFLLGYGIEQKYTGRVQSGSTIIFKLDDIPRTMFYQFSLRYKPQVKLSLRPSEN